MTLGIPKFLDIQDFGFWQLFIFYSGFIGFFQLGLSDGIYLKYGGKKFEQLNKKIIKSEILHFLYFQVLIGLLIIIYLFFADLPYPRFYVILAFSIYLVIGNLITWLGFLLLATNNIKRYSKSILIEKIFFIALLSFIFLSDSLSVYSLIIVFISSKVISLTYLMYLYKDFRKIKIFNLKKSIRFIKSDVSSGAILMMSNIASTLILGIGRFAIDDKWNIEVFGKVSLALSATYFFLLLLNQISFSLFPMLRLIQKDSQRKILKSGSYLVSNLLLAIFILYYPVVYLLNIWIPQYHESLQYLMILMPICLFEGKMQMINTTYFKTLNKQKALLTINLFVLFVSIVLTVLSAYVWESIYAILFTMLFCLALRYVISYIFLFKYYKLNIDSQVYIEFFLSAIFIISLWNLSSLDSFIIYISIFTLYLFLSRKKLLKEIAYFVKL
jgi:O-antigen/teichoic acid export membrane protein